MRWTWAAYPVLGILFVALLAITVGLYVHPAQTSPVAGSSTVRTVEIKGQKVRVAVADTDALRRKGLGGRENLAHDEGMLFMFPDDGRYAFWMKDMRFSIDIVWLSAGGEVVDVAQNISPDTYPNVFTPARAARYVLELPAGWTEEYTVRPGDIVRL
ncbi:DUF192 domain-containing protein [Candidatus Kaiserbacteria bacterium]|nr:DUF192 domain-containing protein [Candidatus Kaiserbacteria bacterium]